ncbi:MAG: hypothetical protein WEC39_01355 [Patescibacteria group bacterium]
MANPKTISLKRDLALDFLKGFSSYPTKLMTNDPWRGQLNYDRALFLATWSDINYTAIAIYK